MTLLESSRPLQEWIGNREVLEETLAVFPLTAMAATMDCPPPATVPPLWHWLYFLPVAPMSQVGADGHPQRGGFLPPVALPRRMWAGGRLTFHAPLHPGKPARRVSTIENIEDKTGRTGRLVFVTVSHHIQVDDAVCVEEEHDIVYREAPAPDAPAKAPAVARTDEVWRRDITADPVLLFRYSALTFNGHRIHYDHPYVTEVEGYPGLIVHGPLIATLLADLVARNAPESTLASFAFRAIRPTFANQPFTVCGVPSEDGNTVELWARDGEGFLTMQATAMLRPAAAAAK